MKSLIVVCGITLALLLYSCRKEDVSYQKRSIFAMSEKDIETFEGRRVEELLEVIREPYDRWIWIDKDPAGYALGCELLFYQHDTMSVSVMLKVDSLRYQSTIGKDGEWDKEKFKKEKLSSVLVLIRRASDSCAE